MQDDTFTDRNTSMTTQATPATDEASFPFVGRWNLLISTTNWEKGQIICDWRDALVEEGADASEYSDEAWAERVGGVTGQHVGRLRRVFLRFGDTYTDYEGLYWSHFYAAIDWTDAEMWLEGAIQNEWSISQMRGKRWETLGSPEDLKPNDSEIVSSEMNEDVVEKDSEAPFDTADEEASVQSVDGVAKETSDDDYDEADGATAVASDDSEKEANVRPFANLPKLPEDVSNAFEQFKMAILTHKMLDWQEVSSEDILTSLNALKAFTLAPSGDA